MDLQALMQSEQRVLIARLSFALGGDRDTAEDLVQEAFTRAWRDLPRDLGSERQRAWVHRTARNLAIDELRRRARRPLAAVEEIDGIEQLAAEPDAAREALAALTAHERFVLLLSLIHIYPLNALVFSNMVLPSRVSSSAFHCSHDAPPHCSLCCGRLAAKTRALNWLPRPRPRSRLVGEVAEQCVGV